MRRYVVEGLDNESRWLTTRAMVKVWRLKKAIWVAKQFLELRYKVMIYPEGKKP